MQPSTHEPAGRTPLAGPHDTTPRPAVAPSAEAVIGKGLRVVGEISGGDPLFIDGSVDGLIRLPGARVTVGPNGRVNAGKTVGEVSCITAREIVILGTITGNVCASDRVDIRAQGSLTGNISTARVAIADGAYFRGGIEIRKVEQNA